MKGKLYRKTEGWMVFYVEKNSAYTSASYQKSLPLHPENESIFITYTDYSVDWDGKEVDFKIVNESWDGYKGCTYAKLTNQVPDVRKMVEDDDILIPMVPNVQCRDGKEIGLWMKGWEEGFKEAKSTLYTKEQMVDLLKFVIESKSGLTSEEFRKASYSFMVKKFIQSLKQPKKD